MARILFPILFISILGLANAQQVLAQEPASNPQSNQPQVKVNMLNVCSPSAEEQKEIAAALARVPKEPLFGSDFEVSRGVSTLSDMPSFLSAGQNTHAAGEPSVAKYVRIRREFAVQALFARVQYSFSNDGQNMVETLVLHVRDPKDLIQVSIEDSASSVTSSEAMLGSNSPASRIRLERFGKSSVVLARCSSSEGGPTPDQTAYEPLFSSASAIMTNYRALLNARRTVPDELSRVAAAAAAKAKSQPGGSRKEASKATTQNREKN